MSLDPHSLDRLRELGRKLPKQLPTPTSSDQEKKPINSRLHPVETENNPQSLFRELMQVSQDGTVPPHLLNRLKECEIQQLIEEFKDAALYPSKTERSSEPQAKLNKSRDSFNKRSWARDKSTNQNDDLYIAFERLLLETEDEI